MLDDTKGNAMEETKQETDVAAQLKRIAEHLVFLEKKLDQLLEQKKQQPFKRFGGGSGHYANRGGQRSYGARHSGHSGNAYGSQVSRHPHGAKFQKDYRSHR